MTGAEFARRIGCTEATASRLRNGKQRPGVATLHRITTEFGLAYSPAYRAWLRGARAFGSFLRSEVFNRD